MTIRLATQTLAAIEANIAKDQGASYRVALGKVIPHMKDAYRGEDEGFRSHLGASMIGKECARQIWYGFRWALKSNFSGRMLRLFNRGHLEEARFLAMLIAIGVQVYQQDANGNQFRISDLGGHFGGSGDGVGLGIPDVPAGTACLLEFKTHNDKSFKSLITKGVQEAKPDHYTQMQTYMRKMGLMCALYMGVNKNDDALHAEIVVLDTLHADQFLDRGRQIIMMRVAPQKINESPGWYQCVYCDMKPICHGNSAPARNCRTCHYVEVWEDGTWRCGHPTRPRGVLTKEQQLENCPDYEKF